MGCTCFSWAEGAGEVAECGGFQEEVSWVHFVNPRLRKRFVEGGREPLDPGGVERRIHPPTRGTVPIVQLPTAVQTMRCSSST